MGTDATRCSVCGGPFGGKRIIIDDRVMHERCSYMSHPPHTADDYARLSDKLSEFVEVMRAVNATDAFGYRVAPMNAALRKRVEAALASVEPRLTRT